MSPWVHCGASVPGTRHLARGQRCDDHHLVVRQGELLGLCVSDGAGSAEAGATGAEAACSSFEFTLRHHPELACQPRRFLAALQQRFDENLAFYRKWQKPLNRREFSCTLLCAVLAHDWVTFVQLGDGAIVVEECEAPGEFAYVRWPMQGEYENTTYFLTDDDALERAFCDHQQGVQIRSLALFTDGLQRLALDYAQRTAVSGFFLPLVKNLSRERAGPSVRFSQALREFLSCERVNERTDDDKTLVLAAQCGY